MFTRKKPEKPKSQAKSGRARNLSQYGLFDIPDLNNPGGMDEMEDDEDDDLLEAELLAITGESRKPDQHKSKQGPISLPTSNLDLMVAASLRDIPTDESDSGGDDDPDLLEELNEISGDVEEKPEPKLSNQKVEVKGSQVDFLRERLAMYKEAEANAKATGEAARVRRLTRGVKTLNELMKQASAGKHISEDDIPPPVAVKITEPRSATRDSGISSPGDSAPPLEPTAAEEMAAPSRPAPPPPTPAPPPPTPAPPPPTPAPPPPTPPAVPPRGARTGFALPGLTSQISFPETPTSPPPQVSSDEPSPTTPPTTEVTSSPKHACPEPADSADDAEKQQTVALLAERRDEYKRAALVAKKSGDTVTAISHIKVAKQFDTVIAAVQAGQPVDLSAMPPPPSAAVSHSTHPPLLAEAESQRSGAPESEVSGGSVSVTTTEQEPEEYVVETPSSVLEALEQRLAKYKSQEDAAKAEGNSSKSRRMGRIVKQYTDAIKLHKAGKPFPIEDLPNPPGYPPIPVEGVKPPPSPRPAAHPPPSPHPAAQLLPQPTTFPTAPAASLPTPTPAALQPTPNIPQSVSPQPSTSSDVSPDKQNVRKMGGSRQERQLQQLLQKQKQFKEAALQAKKKGEVNQAKEYLRIAKGFDKLIEASNCGLPVDMSSLPVPPSSKLSLETDFDLVSAEDCIPASPGSEDDILDKLERDLTEQMKKCMETRNHFKAVGDVASANRFEQFALHAKKDLDVIRVTRKHKHPVPRFHYETRSFSIVQCNTDLMDNDLELSLVQGINYNVPNPKEIDTYIRFEFPWPSEEPYRDKTATVYNTNNPVYNEKFTIPIQRNVRACQRVFKRHAIKCEVWSKGGFFRGDSLIGTATVKLQPLETQCVIHESFDLMDGRKAMGGKLEVKVRLRDPILTKQVERVEEKWLVIDH